MATVYDKSSLFLAPSGVSNGTVFVQKPVPIYGSEQVTNGDFSQTGAEQVTNGDFATDSDWFKTGWVIENGQASNSVSGVGNNLYQGNVTAVGKTFKVVIDTTISAGSVVVMLGGGSGGYNVIGETTTSGTFTYYGVSNGTDNRILLQTGSGSTIGSITIDNVSVKEVGQDWTLETGWSIGEDKVVVTNAPNLYQRLTQPSLSFNLNSTYEISVTCSEYSSGWVYLRKPRGAEPDTSLRIDSVGTFVFTLKALTELTEFALAIGALGTDLTITNISVQEVQSPASDFTFTRGSNLSATRVNEDQLIEKGRENVLLQSNQFDTGWGASAVNLTSGQSGYDSSSDAWLIENTGNLISYVFQSVSQSGVQTFSIYAKGGNVDWMRVNAIVSGANANAYFDITNGTIGTSTGAAIDKTITAAGNGFYRISLSFNDTISQIRVQIADGNGDESTPLGSNIYIQDAQLEQGLAATSVITTGGGTVQAGLLENTPRLDYSGGASCPSLLLEPQRTNEIIFSEYFGSSEWIKRTSDSTAAPVVTDNYAVSPEGVQNAARVVVTKPSTDNDFAVINNNNGLVKSAGDKFTLSVYLKATDASQVGKIVDIYTYESGGGYRVVKSHILTNDWVREDAIGTFIVSTGNVELINIGKARSSADGTTLANMATDFLVYGAQFETGSYPTSYIPTYGTSQTRAGEICVGVSDASTFNSTEGVLYTEIAALADDEINRHITLWDGTDTNRLVLKYDNQSNVVQVFNRVGGIETAFLGHNLADITISHKIAVRYKANNYALVIDGVEVDTDTSSSTWPASVLNNIKFSNGSGSDFYGKTKQLIYFPKALSDLQLAILTGATTYETFDEMALALNYTVYE